MFGLMPLLGTSMFSRYPPGLWPTSWGYSFAGHVLLIPMSVVLSLSLPKPLGDMQQFRLQKYGRCFQLGNCTSQEFELIQTRYFFFAVPREPLTVLLLPIRLMSTLQCIHGE